MDTADGKCDPSWVLLAYLRSLLEKLDMMKRKVEEQMEVWRRAEALRLQCQLCVKPVSFLLPLGTSSNSQPIQLMWLARVIRKTPEQPLWLPSVLLDGNHHSSDVHGAVLYVV